MTLQQLQYIVAVDKYRHFVKAAESCGVTQSTLSTMIKNLEDELDVVIFDRSAHPVEPTEIGRKIIGQAKIVIYNARNLEEIPLIEKSSGVGQILLGIIPTVAPYLLPRVFKEMEKVKSVKINVIEAMTSTIIAKLKKAELDMAVLTTPIDVPDLLEIPMYYEKFYAYISPEDPLWGAETVEPSLLPGDSLWLLQEGHCFRNQITNFCKRNTTHSILYESGSIDTLIKVVDLNGGHTIIPELHLQFLSDSQMKNVRHIVSPEPVREISLVIRKDYVKERLVNIFVDAVKTVIPADMLDTGLRNFAVRI